jgi:hypothetical protein
VTTHVAGGEARAKHSTLAISVNVIAAEIRTLLDAVRNKSRSRLTPKTGFMVQFSTGAQKIAVMVGLIFPFTVAQLN